MSKNKTNKTESNSTETPRVAGRPRNKISIPQGKFTFLKLCILNGAVGPNGEELTKENGRRMVPLTLRNWLSRQEKMGEKSEVVKLEELGKATHEDGLGRRPFLYTRRSNLDKTKVATADKPAKAPKASKPSKRKTADVTVPAADVSTPAPTPEATPVEVPADSTVTVNA